MTISPPVVVLPLVVLGRPLKVSASKRCSSQTLDGAARAVEGRVTRRAARFLRDSRRRGGSTARGGGGRASCCARSRRRGSTAVVVREIVTGWSAASRERRARARGV